MQAIFNPGEIVWTGGVSDLSSENTEFAAFVAESLKRHLNGDWGGLDDEDIETNKWALNHGGRLLSAYNDDRFPKSGVATLWIITESDRSVTTILFPDEY